MNTLEPQPCNPGNPVAADRAYLKVEIQRLETLLLTRTNFDNWSVSTVDASERARTESALRSVAHGKNGRE